LFSVWPVLASMYALEPYYSMQVSIHGLIMFATYWTISRSLTSRSDLEWAIVVVLLCALLQSLLGLFQFWSGDYLVFTDQEVVHLQLSDPTGGVVSRAVGLFVQPNYLASYLSVVLPVAFTFALSGGRFGLSNNIAKIVVPLAGAAMLASLSRGAIVGMLTGIAAGVQWFPTHLGMSKKRIPVSLLFLICITVGSVFFLDSSMARNWVQWRVEYRFEEFAADRVGLVLDGANIFFSDLSTGIGPGSNYWYLTKPVHNIYIRQAMELGFPGILLFLLFLCSSFRLMLKTISLPSCGERSSAIAAGFFMGLVAFSVHGLVDVAYDNPQVQAFFFGLLGVAASDAMGNEMYQRL